MTTTTYEFTAFTEADLLGAGAEGHSVSCGDTFTMSGTATTCFEVTDNDAFLSGDNYCNENANDHYGQQASITGENGEEIGNGGQIYAEKYFWVHDDAGNWYVMLQIEQEGTGEEYFTFFNGYGYETPAEGTNLTVYSSCNVTSDWVDYKCLDAGDKEPDPGWIKGRLTLDADCNDNEWNDDTGQWDEGIEGQTVQLLDLDGNVVAESITDSYGNYMFDVAPGEYRVKFPEIDGMKFSAQDSGVAEHYDSDADENGLTDVITVSSGQTVANIDAGVKPATGSIEGRVFCDDDCDGIDGTATSGKGDNLLINSGFEHNTLNDSGYTWEDLSSGWYNIGSQNANILEQDYGHGNATGDAIAELECGVILCQAVNLDEAGSYCLSFDISRRGHVDQDNTFQLFIDGVLFETYVAQGQETIEIQLDLGAGTHRFDFKSLSQSYKGAGLDDVELRQEIDTVEPEPGKEGVVVVLLDANGDEVLDSNGDRIETVTDADGNYRFDDVPEGDYRVKFENPDGTEFTFQNVGDDDTIDSDVDGNGVSDVVSVVADQTTSDVDAGLKPVELGSLSGRYFSDENRDGLDNDGANGISGIQVELLDENGVGLGIFETTDAEGNYSFGDLAAGTYGVKFTDPDTGRELTTQDVDMDASDDIDSDASDVGGGMSAINGIVVVAGADTPDNDAGVVELLGSLSGRYFCDDDGDGLDNDGVNGGEGAGIEGIRVDLLDANGQPTGMFTTTGPNGAYSFTGLVAGTYGVQFADSPPTKDFTTTNADNDVSDDIDSDAVANNDGTATIAAITVVGGQDTADNDVGVTPIPGSLSGRYFFDGDRDGLDNDGANGISGIQVELLDENGVGLGIFETTDAEGNYSFGDLDAGTYGVKFTDPDTGRELTTQNVDMDASDDIDSDAADVGGGMSVINGIVVVSGADTPDNDAGVQDQAGSLSGTYFCDDNRDGDDDGAGNGDADIAGKTVTLLNADGTPALDIDGNAVDPVLTDGNGDYSFENLAAGDYVVMFEATEGKEFIAANAAADDIDSDVVDAANGKTAPVTVNAGEETKDVDAGVQDQLGSLSGRYFCDDNRDGLDNDGDTGGEGPGVAGIRVDLLDATGAETGRFATTDAQGNYSFANLVAGTYGVRFEEGVLDKVLTTQNVDNDVSDDIDSDAMGDDLGFAAITNIVVLPGQNTPDNDIGVAPQVGSLSGRYFFDVDRDGLDNDGANGINGIQVELLDENGDPTGTTTTTDGQGNYSFGVLAAGTYGVKFTDPDTGRVLTTQNVDMDASDDIDSDAADVGGGMSTINGITVVGGQNTPDNDAGVVEGLGSLSGRYFCDENGNSLDDGEPGVGGRTVTLLAEDGVTVLGTTETADDGSYSFADLSAGNYIVNVRGAGFVAQDVDGDVSDDIDSDVDATGTTNVIMLGAGEDLGDVDAGTACFELPEDGSTFGVQALLDGSSGQYGITMPQDGELTYTAATDSFSVRASLDDVPVNAANGFSSDAALALDINVDDNGVLVGGAADDFLIFNDTNDDGELTAGEEIYLQGQVVAFGSGNFAGGPSAFYDYFVELNGGTLADQFDPLIGVSQSSGAGLGVFDGTFDEDFVESAKGRFGDVDVDCFC